MGGLSDVSSMDAVVIWNIFEVVVLQGPEEVQEYFSGDFEGLDQVPFLRYYKYDQIPFLHYGFCYCNMSNMLRFRYSNMSNKIRSGYCNMK